MDEEAFGIFYETYFQIVNTKMLLRPAQLEAQNEIDVISKIIEDERIKELFVLR